MTFSIQIAERAPTHTDMLSSSARLAMLFSILCAASCGGEDRVIGEDLQDTVDGCAAPHEGCAQGDAGCWQFGPAEDLSFYGFFVAECDETHLDCDAGEQCKFNPACGLDAPCPGLCVIDACVESQAAACTHPHVECAQGDADCWFFSGKEQLTFEGFFVPECDDVDPTCETGACAVDSACGLDAPCPGLCVDAACMLGS